MRRWWAATQSPAFLRTLNGWLTLGWIAMIPVSIVTGWIHSVTYVAALSLWALVASHWAAWQAGRVEVAQHDDANVQDVLDVLESRGGADAAPH